MFLFDASKVMFEPGTVKFKIKSESLNFDSSLFRANANLYDYKFLDGQNFSFTDRDISFEDFNASDYRALQYAFNGDELFDSKYYLDQKSLPLTMNPFTDYTESGFSAGLNPNRLFDVNYYLETNIDIRDALIDPFKHYSSTIWFKVLQRLITP